LGRLLRLCLGLHQAHSGGSFRLSCRQAANYLRVGRMTAIRLLQLLVKDGKLLVTRAYPRVERKTNEYRLI
jgi:hypothetical protein